ncbi:Gem-associated protein 2 [Apodemus speciosus]|uniref:Gem-associated protein 2 n=1 Tax=Apodemus speciosus TaxID=105296 RepID=A0ABQ0FDZ4_APOSI
MPRLLPVEPCDLTEGFDPSVPPRTPQEYLRRVQIEAAQCPDVVVAQIDPKKLKRKQSVNISECSAACRPACQKRASDPFIDGHELPYGCWSLEEQLVLLTAEPSLQLDTGSFVKLCLILENENFRDASLHLRVIPQHFSGSNNKWHIFQLFDGQSVHKHRDHWRSQQLDSDVAMPKSEDEEGWKKFCLGERLCAEGATGPSTDESPGIDYVQGLLAWVVLPSPLPPRVITIAGVASVCLGWLSSLAEYRKQNESDLVTITSVLEYLSNWFGERDFTPELVLQKKIVSQKDEQSAIAVASTTLHAAAYDHFIKFLTRSYELSAPFSEGRWFYALLACLEKPLLPEAHSLIRQLARRCSEVRLLVGSKDDERVPALNLLICLVSRYFDQRDLADEPS